MTTARHMTILTWLPSLPQVITYNGPSSIYPNQTVQLYDFHGHIIEWNDLGRREEMDGEVIREYEVYIDGKRFSFGRLYSVKRDLNNWFREKIKQYKVEKDAESKFDRPEPFQSVKANRKGNSKSRPRKSKSSKGKGKRDS